MIAPDPEFPQGWLETTPPSEGELRDLRRIVHERLHGVTYSDQHSGRKTFIKQAPGKFRKTITDLANCGHERVICDIPTSENESDPDPRNMRICLVCDAGRELLGLPT
jgi:hypothetical protein